MPIVLAAPPVTPPPGGMSSGLRMRWIGSDGSEWDLRDWRAGVCLLLDGVTGLHFPSIDKYKSTSRAVPGFRNRGWRAASRDVFWPLYVYGDGSEPWRDVYRRFFDTIHPQRAGVWEVTSGTETRSLRLTGVFDDEHQFARDPYAAGWSIIPVQMEPEQPFWEGKTIRRGPFSAPTGVDFIPPTLAPSFHISPAATFASATIPNFGDVDAYLVWTVEGPLTDVVLGVGGVTATVPFSLAAGQVLRIDTDPRNVSALLDGVDATEQLGLLEFAPVPSGGSAPLTVSASGAGGISAELTPLYFRAM
ncbi:hypothetical protein ACUOFU_16810 [Microbacterium arabinogalactanolyticum]|uniref:hypothetical protein n=1 Tax=Microbacterium arabinogalactanolyticum TaxID=69365 RepID=UPI004044680A